MQNNCFLFQYILKGRCAAQEIFLVIISYKRFCQVLFHGKYDLKKKSGLLNG